MPYASRSRPSESAWAYAWGSALSTCAHAIRSTGPHAHRRSFTGRPYHPSRRAEESSIEEEHQQLEDPGEPRPVAALLLARVHVARKAGARDGVGGPACEAVRVAVLRV